MSFCLDHGGHYKIHGKDFDYKTQPLSDLPEADYNKFVIGKKHNVIPPDAISLTNHLNWYLQNVLNASAHTHSNFDFKGFISTTTQMDSILKVPDLNKKEKWIYVTYVEGGFLMPEPWKLKFKTNAFSFAKTALNEVTVPGGIPWEDVIAYTQLDASTPIYFRKNFDIVDPKAYDTLLKKLASSKRN